MKKVVYIILALIILGLGFVLVKEDFFIDDKLGKTLEKINNIGNTNKSLPNKTHIMDSPNFTVISQTKLNGYTYTVLRLRERGYEYSILTTGKSVIILDKVEIKIDQKYNASN